MASQTLEFNGGIFEMFDSEGVSIGGAIDVIGSISIDITTGQGSANFSSKTPFFGYLWTAHDIVVQMTSEDTMKVSMLFDWGDNTDIVVAVDMGIDFNADGTARFTTLDTDGDNILGYPMDNGPFVGFSAAFSGAGTLVVNSAPVASDDIAITDEDTSITIDVLANDAYSNQLIQVRNIASITKAQASIDEYGADYSGGDLTTLIKYEIWIDASALDQYGTATEIRGYQFSMDFDPAEVGAFDFSLIEGVNIGFYAANTANSSITFNSELGSVAIASATAIVDIDPTNDDAPSFLDREKLVGTFYVSSTDPAATSVNITLRDMLVVTDTNSISLDAYSYPENVPTDIDGDILSVISATAENGEVIINADSTLVYIGSQDFNGVDKITYIVSDGELTDTATVLVDVVAVNDSTIITNSTAIVDEDGSVLVDLTANATDIDGDVLTITSASAANGTIIDGFYTPNANFNGVDIITYTVNDSATTTVTVTVNAVNDAPVASYDLAKTQEDGSAFIDVLANDIDVDGDTLTVISATAENGTVTIKDDGVLAYIANQRFDGIDAITYTISDGNGATDTAIVKVSVTTSYIESGDSYEGDLSDSDDENWHEVELKEGNKYVFRLEDANRGGGTLKDAYIELYDESGEVVVKYDGLSDAVIGLIAPADGEYYLVVKSRNSEEIGSYNIITRAVDDHGADREDATSISFDIATDTVTVTGGIQWSDEGLTGVPEELEHEIPDHDEDWLSIALDKDDDKQFVTFELESLSAISKLNNATIEIFDPNNNLVARASGKDLDDGVASITLQALSTGEYTVRVTDAQGSTGDYQLIATKTYAPDDKDFDLDFEEEVEIEDSVIEINDIDDIVKVTGDLVFEIDAPDIRESREEIGEYGTFSIDKVTKKYEFTPDDILKSAILAGEKTIEISSVDALDAYIPSSSYKYIAIDKEAPEYFEIELEDSLGNITAKTVRVEVKEIKDASHFPKHDEVVEVGNIGISSDMDIHKIPVIASNSYFVEVVSVADGITAPLKEAKMKLIGEITLSKSDSNSVSSMPSAIFEANEDGFVLIHISSRTDIDAGQYAFRVIKLGLDGGDDAIDQIADYDANDLSISSLLVGESRYGSLENSSDVDIIAINLVEGQKTTIEVSSKGALANTHIQLLNSAGEEIAFAKSDYDLVAQIHAQATESGVYFVKVNNARIENNKGDYLINIINQSDNVDWTVSSSDGTVGLEGEASQWYVDQLNVEALNGEYTGAGVTINVVDTGVDYTHSALISSINTNDDLNSYAVHQNSGGGSYAASITDYGGYDFDTSVDTNMQFLFNNVDKPWHGTFVSGIIAGDSIPDDFKGISYNAQIVSYHKGYTDSTAYVFDPINNSSFQDMISNNSWNYNATPFNDNFLENGTTASALGQAIEDATGAGIIFVFSAGNFRTSQDNVNYHNLTNSPLTIAVASVDREGVVASSSTPGAAILVAAYGEEIYSTDIVGDVTDISLSDANYAIQSGTSFAAPEVSAIIALMLEANSTLGYRDIQSILAHSATKTEHADVNYWQYNQSDNHNLGGMHFNDDMGFGIVNAYSAVRLAETWQNTLSAESSLDLTYSDSITDNASISKVLNIATDINVEHIVLEVDLDHNNLAQLTIEITSPGPDGTTSTLMSTPNSSDTGLNFEFSSVQFYGENSAGDWTVTITDDTSGVIGTLNNLKLTVYGSAVDGNDQYIFTDEFVAPDPLDVPISDDVGTDWINASAVTSDIMIDLTPISPLGAPYYSAGPFMIFMNNQAMVVSPDISALTSVANIVTGDGNDTLTASNAVNNILNGGRGNDTVIYANPLSDYTVDFTNLDYILVTNVSSSIIDTLYAIENLNFTDGTYQTFVSSPGEDTSVAINNLSFVQDSLTVNLASANNGIVNISADGTIITYTGNPDFNGTDTITYTLSDESEGTIDVTVVPVNDNPVANDDDLGVTTIGSTPVTITSVLDNDTDIEGDNLSVISATAPNGVVTVNADSVLEYTSNSDFSGTDTITYTVSDGNGGSDTATVDVIVSSINAMIQTDIDNYLDNLTLHYYKDGLDTGVSTLVENGAINFDQVLDFDMVKLSVSNAYLGGTEGMGLVADDAVAVKLHVVTVEQIDTSIPTIGDDPLATVIDPDSFNWHAADVDNSGDINVGDAVDILSHIVAAKDDIPFSIDSFDLVDSLTYQRVTSLDVEATETANWTIVANGDVTQDGVWDDTYTVAVEIV